jgi:hypothetical protein
VAAGKIFVCYRREDSAGHAGRLYDRLNQRFPGRVFMDVAGIVVGTRWAEVIEETLRSCEVAVILIGRRWLERDSGGVRRLDHPDDSLRAEVTTALRLKLKIVPLLVAGAGIPEHGDLPPEVAPITEWQALRIDDDDFDHDSTRLIKALERQLGDEGTDPHLDSAGTKQAEIERLLASAETSIARADWITAAQTLQAVLSLDRAHPGAEARLRFVHEQSARTYKSGPQPRAQAGKWAALGAVGAIVLLGAAGVVVVVIALMLSSGSTARTGPGTDPVSVDLKEGKGARPIIKQDAPADRTEPRNAAPVPPPVQSVQSQLAGDYVLASYSLQGLTLPVSGGMQLIPVSDGRFQFSAVMTNRANGVTYQYQGFFDGQGSRWTTTTVQTNDPTAVPGPIPTQVNFDGSRLAMRNSYGQAAVWRKQ